MGPIDTTVSVAWHVHTYAKRECLHACNMQGHLTSMAKMLVVAVVVVLAFVRPDALATVETELSDFDEEFAGASSLAAKATAGPVCASSFGSRCLGTKSTNQQKKLCGKLQELCDELIKVPGVAELKKGLEKVTAKHHKQSFAAAKKLLKAQLKLNAGLETKLRDVASLSLVAMTPDCAQTAKIIYKDPSTDTALSFGSFCIEPLLVNGGKYSWAALRKLSPAVEDEGWLGLMITCSFLSGVLPTAGASASSMQASSVQTILAEDGGNLDSMDATREAALKDGQGHRQQLWWGFNPHSCSHFWNWHRCYTQAMNKIFSWHP